MLLAAAYLLNILLVATGVWDYLKLNWVSAFLAGAIGAVNLLVLYFNRTRGLLAALAAVGSLVALTQGVILGYSGVTQLIEQGSAHASGGFWDMVSSGSGVSYAMAYIGAGLIMLVILASERRAPARP